MGLQGVTLMRSWSDAILPVDGRVEIGGTIPVSWASELPPEYFAEGAWRKQAVSWAPASVVNVTVLVRGEKVCEACRSISTLSHLLYNVATTAS